MPDIEQDIKPQLNQSNGDSASFQLVNSKVDFDDDPIESDNEMDVINIKEEIDPDEPSTSEPPVISSATRRGRKRKSYVDDFNDEDEEYRPVKRPTARKRTYAKRGRPPKAKVGSSRSRDVAKLAAVPGEFENDGDEQFDETQEKSEDPEDETEDSDGKSKRK